MDGDSSGTKWNQEVIGIENDIYVVRYGKEIRGLDKNTMNHLFGIDKNNRRTKFTGSRSKVLDFPLYVGKKWRNNSSFTDKRGGRWNVSEAYSVSSHEDVKVVGGTFRAFKIEYGHSDTRTGKELASATYWYSPEVKAIVKLVEFKSLTVGNMELISYELAQ